MSDVKDASEFADLVKNATPANNRRSRASEGALRDFFNEMSAPSIAPGTPSQYALYRDGYKATTTTIDELRSGTYDIRVDDNGYYVVPMPPPTGLLLELPEMRSKDVLDIVDKFWDSEKDYKEGNDYVVGGASFKAGLMLYGPPGTGKTCVVKLVSKKLVERGGLVFFASTDPFYVLKWLTDFSLVEKNRKCIVILEDIDTLIQNYGEAVYLEMLDSAKTIDNILFIATTNYPENLDPRIYNRPGRFSHIVKVGYPTPAMREAYLKAILKKHDDVEYIVKNSDQFTIDHLSSLVNSVYRERKELKSEIERLRALFRIGKSTDDEKGMGIL